MNRIVKHKGTKAARKLPSDFEKQKEEKIPQQLVISFDHTGIKIVLASNWTLAVQGSKQIGVIGL